MSIDPLFSHEYDRNTYNCAHFLGDAWEHITGDDIRERMKGFLLPASCRSAPMTLRHKFRRLSRPVSPCIVIMSRAKTVPHTGMFYNGRVLHITERGVAYQPLDVVSLGFSTVRFYR